MTVALILGGANTLNDDLDNAKFLLNQAGILNPVIIACNHAGRTYPGYFHHWVTLHTELMPDWIDQRRKSGLPDPDSFWTSSSHRRTIPPQHRDMYRKIESWDGSSGLFCVTVALHLGYDKIILCGVPLDKKAEHFNYRGEWADAPRYRRAWSKNLHRLKHTTRSKSGWTNLILGSPTLEWLNA